VIGADWTDWVGSALAGACALVLAVVSVADRGHGIRLARRWARPGEPDAGGSLARRAAGAGSGSRWPRRSGDAGAALALVVAEVAARLRAGMPTEAAWRAAWARAPGLGPLGPLDGGGAPQGVVLLARRPRWRDLALPATRRSLGGLVLGIRDVLRAGAARSRSGRRAAAALVAACRFTHRLGAPLADVLEVVADGIDESTAAEEARRVARSGPAASARVLTVLPLAGVAAGEALGARPLERLTGGGVGTLCLVVGVACLAAGHIVSRRMLRLAEGRDAARGSGAGAVSEIDPAILCDLVVAGLESGASVPAALEALGEAAGLADLGRIGRELVLGVPWRVAWDPCPVQAVLVGRTLEPAWTDGTSPVPLLRRAAAQLRSRRVSDARAEAEELAVRLVVPLGALLLPAFLALGVVPVLLHLGAGGLSGLS
jgi:tight adherence protein B